MKRGGFNISSFFIFIGLCFLFSGKKVTFATTTKTTVMLKKIFFILFCFLGLTAYGQIQFGYLSYQKVLTMMPEYKTALNSLNTLKEKCNQEAKRSEDELERKYAEFLQGQSEFPENILQKRQNELQTLIKNGISFREESEKLLKNAEEEMKEGMENKLNLAIQTVGQEQGLAFILNTDNNSCPFINKNNGVDITEHVLFKLGITKTRPSVSESGNNLQNAAQQNGQAGTLTDTPIQKNEDEFLKNIDATLIDTINQTDSISDDVQ